MLKGQLYSQLKKKFKADQAESEVTPVQKFTSSPVHWTRDSSVLRGVLMIHLCKLKHTTGQSDQLYALNIRKFAL